jgi:[Skp1-protein]-hydroxyproline N-acetylglucosaminyltransferase
MVTMRRRKQAPQLFRSDPIIAGLSLIALVFSLVIIFYLEATKENISIEELVIKEEKFGVAKFNQFNQFRQQSFKKLRYYPAQEDAADLAASEEPMTIDEVTEFLYKWVHGLHAELLKDENLSSAQAMWKTYHDWTRKMLVPWDKEYLRRMPVPRQDDSIFLSLATYRDENCLNTLSWAYGNATYPERLFVGLVQQNCYENCRSGVQEHGGTIETPPDQDCHQAFCDLHPNLCSQIRPLKLKEIESLGPYGARFLASKLYDGEQFYMQLDAHMTFLEHWDDITLKSIHKAPSNKPIIAHYPPGHKMDLANHWAMRPAGRLCGPVFSKPDGGIVRLEGLRKWDKIKIPIPRFAPFVAAGFLFGTALLLKEVPFDPYLPWIFMGEEMIMSTRFWTSGYDLFSPAQAVVGHIYVREHKPKFWETMSRFFKHAAHDDIEALVLLRITHQLGYPEAARDLITETSVLSDLAHYSMGHVRTIEQYMQYAGIDVMRKEIFMTNYCEEHIMPPGKEHLAKLYEDAEAESRKNATLVEQGK